MQEQGTIVLGSRGSALARTQCGMVEKALREAWPELVVRIVIITTRGDEERATSVAPLDRKAGRKGMFTSEIERALLAGEIDVAVHSAKDLPSEQAAGLEIAAVLPRAAVEDVLLTKTAVGFRELPPNAVIGTGSVRREYQLRASRPDIRIVDLRGNVPTRIRKLGASDWDGIVLARAGLDRLGFELGGEGLEFEGARYHCERLPAADFLAAGGQGIIALQVRSEDQDVVPKVRAVSHRETLLCLHGEREFLRQLNGDCDSPVGVLARMDGGTMTIRAQVFNPPSTEPLRGEVQGPADEGNIARLAAELMEQINGR